MQMDMEVEQWCRRGGGRHQEQREEGTHGRSLPDRLRRR
jgi:hypothetical protein